MRRAFVGSMLVVAALGGWLWYESRASAASVTLPDGTRFAVEVADSAEERRVGLSDHPWLDQDRGMLFVFEAPVQPSFWMKDMDFPIDIVWIAGGSVVGVAADAPVPADGIGDGELPRYLPPGPVDMVLELNAGVAATHGLEPGDGLDIKRP